MVHDDHLLPCPVCGGIWSHIRSLHDDAESTKPASDGGERKRGERG